MSFTIPDQVLRATGLNKQQMAQEIAVMLFQEVKGALRGASGRSSAALPGGKR